MAINHIYINISESGRGVLDFGVFPNFNVAKKNVFFFRILKNLCVGETKVATKL